MNILAHSKRGNMKKKKQKKRQYGYADVRYDGMREKGPIC